MSATHDDLRPALAPNALYFGDNGRCFCGKLHCAGMTAHYTGRDLSGLRVERITPAVLRAEGLARIRCEMCGLELKAGAK